jgi:hypothetical protein
MYLDREREIRNKKCDEVVSAEEPKCEKSAPIYMIFSMTSYMILPVPWNDIRPLPYCSLDMMVWCFDVMLLLLGSFLATQDSKNARSDHLRLTK